MGQTAAKFSQTLRLLREDSEELTIVELEGVNLSEKELRKLGDALRTNRYGFTSNYCIICCHYYYYYLLLWLLFWCFVVPSLSVSLSCKSF